MTVEELSKACGFIPAFPLPDPEREVTCGFCGDLLSWAMGRAKEGSAWCTVMGSVNAVAVASLADAAVLVLCHEAALMGDAAARAQQQGINILRTDLPEFEAAAAVAKQLGI